MKKNRLLPILFTLVTAVFVVQAAAYFQIIRDLREKWDAVLYERNANAIFGTDALGMPDSVLGLSISDSGLTLSNALGLNAAGVGTLTATNAYEYAPITWNGSNYYMVLVATN